MYRKIFPFIGICILIVSSVSCSNIGDSLQKPGIPSGLELVSLFPCGCEIQWQPVTNAESYSIKVSCSAATINLTSAETSLIIDGLSEKVPYEIAVCACTEFTSGEFSESISVTISNDTEKTPEEDSLKAPDLLSLQSISSSEIRVQWNAVEPAESYTVFFGNVKSTSLDSVEVKENSLVLNGLQEMIDYVVKVKAYSGGKASPFSQTQTGRTLLSIPQAPEISLIIPSSASICLSWTTVYNAEEYLLFSGAEESSLKEILKTTDSSTVVENLESGTPYYFSVKAVNAAGTSSASALCCTSTACIIPGVPENIIASPVSQTELALSWNTVPGAAEYDIEYGPAKSSMNQKIICTDPFFILSNLEENTVIYFKIRAVNTTGKSSWSDTVYATTLLSPPEKTVITLLKLNNSTNPSSLLIRWTAVDKAAEYAVYRSPDANPVFEKIAVCTGTQYMDAEAYTIQNETKYSYCVEPLNSGGSGGLSDTVSGILHKPKLYFDVTGKTMSGYYEFYLDNTLLCPSVFIDYAGEIYTLKSSVETGNRTLQFRFRKTEEDPWSTLLSYEPLQVLMGAAVTYKCSSMTNLTKTVEYKLD